MIRSFICLQHFLCFNIGFEASPLFILFGYSKICLGISRRHRPFNSDIGIVKCYSAFVVRMIEIGAFVYELSVIRKHDETVCKVLGNEKLLFILCGQNSPEPFSEGG